MVSLVFSPAAGSSSSSSFGPDASARLQVENFQQLERMGLRLVLDGAEVLRVQQGSDRGIGVMHAAADLHVVDDGQFLEQANILKGARHAEARDLRRLAVTGRLAVD